MPPPAVLARFEAVGVEFQSVSQIPETAEGWVVLMCFETALQDGTLSLLRQKGLKIAWGNEMMWLLEGERGALLAREIDCILYASNAQRHVLEPDYWLLLAGGNAAYEAQETGEYGNLLLPDGTAVPWVVVGNYISPENFPYIDRTINRRFKDQFVIGRLSRDDYHKYPTDFPSFYQGLGLAEPVRYRAMAWSPALSEHWPETAFTGNWDRLPILAEHPVEFLQSLDLFVYDTGPLFSESWGRAVVEAMLTGAIPILSADPRHHLRNLITDGVSGFLCATRDEFGARCRQLQQDTELRCRMSRQAREYAVEEHCNEAQHLELWSRVFQ